MLSKYCFEFDDDAIVKHFWKHQNRQYSGVMKTKLIDKITHRRVIQAQKGRGKLLVEENSSTGDCRICQTMSSAPVPLKQTIGNHGNSHKDAGV